jgi:UPF0176 protein
MTLIVAALYKFAPLVSLPEMQKDILQVCRDNDVSGTLLLAAEGINGTIAGTRGGIDAVLAFLRSFAVLADLEHKESFAEDAPFYRMKVRLKKEIVTIGIPDVNPNETVGKYLDPEEWNALISDPDTIILDTRNEYEVNIGTFKGAINPHTESFREFPDYVQKNLDSQKHKKVAMFCTGGIRCEKASSYMMGAGFDEVYHLKGGILKYLEQIPETKSLWEGECFVFDQRVAVKHGLELGSYALCPSCRYPLNAQDKQSSLYHEGVTCPHCHDTQTAAQKTAATERQKQIKLATGRGEKHLGAHY